MRFAALFLLAAAATPQQVTLRGGLLGTAARASCDGRLKHFINSEKSEPIAIFSPEAVAKNFAGDWNGEHAGKWLYTAARAAARTGDRDLAANVRRIADYLVSRQEPGGYLGTYAPASDARMTSPHVAGKRTWDLWVESYVILGLLEVNRFFPDPKYLNAARRVDDLCYGLFVTQKRSTIDMGNHDGLSGTILIEPAVELYRATGDRKYLELAEAVVSQAEGKLGLVSRAVNGRDLQEIGDGKIYQLLWNYVGLAKLYEETREPSYLRAVTNAWNNVVEQHLTPAGGPWGGVAGHYEVFNPKGYFNPAGMVETCSTMSWIHLNRELLRLTGESKYADQIERTLYNSLLGAADPNGEDWAYFIFPNGPRSNTYYWACCKSSGALALEEIAPLIAGPRESGIAVNLYTDADVRLETATLSIQTQYPRDGKIAITLHPAKSAAFPVFLRIPDWAEGAAIQVNGQRVAGTVLAGAYHRLDREWKDGDQIALDLPMQLKIVPRAYSIDHHGSEIAHIDYMALTRGPLVYATDKKYEPLKVPKATAGLLFSPAQAPLGFDGPAFHLNLPGRDPILFLPYYEAGGRAPGKWRSTWLEVAWQ